MVSHLLTAKKCTIQCERAAIVNANCVAML